MSTPAPGQQRRQERGRIEQLDAVVAHDVGDGGDQRVGVAGLEPGQDRQQRQVGHDAREDLDVLDLPGHDRLGDAGGLQDLDALAEVAERDPVEVGPRLPGGPFELGKGLFLDGDDGDVVAEGARP